jgi:hypothetical protein
LQRTADVQCVRFIIGMANFDLKTHAKSHRSQKGYDIKLVDLQNFLNDVVIDSPHLGGVKSTIGPSSSHGGGQPTSKRNHEDPLVGASKIWKRNLKFEIVNNNTSINRLLSLGPPLCYAIHDLVD